MTPTLPLPATDGCYFCDLLASGGEAWNLIARTERTATFLNAGQYEVGQCLVVPLRHAPTLLDLTDDEAGALLREARGVARLLVDLYRPDGILLYQNNGTGSGQEVPHVHLHVVPRRPESRWGAGPPALAELAETDDRALDAELDHTHVTDAKLATATKLRIAAAAPPGGAELTEATSPEKSRRPSGRAYHSPEVGGSRMGALEEANRSLVERWFREVWNERRLETVDELFGAEGRGHMEGTGTVGPEEFKAFRAALLGSFSDFRIELKGTLAEGDEVAARWEFTGTHDGDGLGVPPTGKQVRVPGITWFEVRDGRIAEGWDAWNQGAFLDDLRDAAT